MKVSDRMSVISITGDSPVHLTVSRQKAEMLFEINQLKLTGLHSRSTKYLLFSPLGIYFHSCLMFGSLNLHLSFSFRRNQSLHGPSPVTTFGPKACMLQNPHAVM